MIDPELEKRYRKVLLEIEREDAALAEAGRARRAEDGGDEARPPRGNAANTAAAMRLQKIVEGIAKSPDIMTFFERAGHFHLASRHIIAEHPSAPDEFRTRWAVVLKWLGVERADQLTIAHYKKWARGFDVYLRQGRAPSPELGAEFGSFKRAMVHGYRTTVGDTRYAEEVREVMDRLVMSEAAVSRAEASAETAPLFPSAKAAGLSQDEMREYRRQAEQSHEAASREVTMRMLDDLDHQRQAERRGERARVEKEIAPRVHRSPVYRAIDWLADKLWRRDERSR